MRGTLTLLILCFAYPAIAQVADSAAGTLNPDEMSLQRSIDLAKRGQVGMVICSQGYLMTKQGSHEQAREIFQACAKRGYTGTMTWMSYMDTNGFGARENPQAAAEWDRKAADAGDPIGALNFGLDLLRGHGVRRNEMRAREYIDRAAEAGVKDAILLKNSDYDPDVVTPDADAKRYEKRVF